MATIMKKKLKSLFSYSLATLMLVAPGQALANGEELQADTVHVSATRVDKELLDVPMSVSVVTREQIEKSPASTVADLLKDVPGVEISNSGTGGLKRVLIRGEDARRSLVLVDGQKISEHKSMDGPAILLDPSIIERIEVIRGPASVLYGAEAMGGVVNIITKKGGTKPIQGHFSVGYDGSTRGFTESLSLYGAYNGWKYRVSGSNSYAHNLLTADGEAEHTKHTQRQATGFLSYDFSDNFTLGGSFEKFYSEVNGGVNDEGAKDYKDFWVDMDPWERTKVALFAEAKNVTDWLPRLRFDAFWQETHKDFENWVHPNSGATMDVIQNPRSNNYIRSFGANLQADWQIGDNHYLITGYDFLYDKLDATSSNRGNIDVHMTGPMANMMNGKLTSYNNKDFAGLQVTHAVFAQMESKLPKDFTLNYGARYTWVNSSISKAEGYKWGVSSNQMSPILGSSYAGPEENVGKLGNTWDARPVFNASLMWQGIKDLTLRAGWSQGFRVPGLDERYIPSSMGGGTIEPNPSLTPEFSDNFEVGARYSAHGLNLDAVIFYSIANDYIHSRKINSSTSQFVNVSTARTHGIEASISYDLPYGFTPYTNLTYMRRELDYGEDFDDFKTYNSGSPTWHGRAGLRTKHEIAKNVELNGDFYARFASACKSESYDPSTKKHTETYYHPWTTANASLGVSFGEEKQYNITGEVLNIFNEKYQINGAIYEPGVHANLKFSVSF